LGQDADFDEIGSAFEEDIYGSSKGHVRLEVLWTDLLDAIPALREGALTVLDAGGGAGHVAIRLAQQGNRVVLCDPSREMLDRAEEAIRKAEVGDTITTVQASIQELATVLDDRFDVITCHGVLEWLAEPREAVARLVRFLHRDGYLSLMFYNRNAWLLKRVLSGDVAAALGKPGYVRRTEWGAGAVPLPEETVREWLGGLGFAVRSKSGIRIFHDYLAADARSGDQLDALLEVELALRGREPFSSLGQHVHLVCSQVDP
jgi:S-adenosylmethionine-dependent methyltransferase